MKHYVYRLDDPITKEFYIGSRSCKYNIEDDPYMGSYCAWKPEDKSRLVKTILKSNFRKRETAIKYESALIKENIDNILNRNYNIPTDGWHTTGRKHTIETREIIRQKRSQQILTTDVLEMLRTANTGKKFSDDHKNKISKSKQEYYKTHTIYNKGLFHTKKTLQKMSDIRSGTTHSIETKHKLSEIAKNRIKVKCPYCSKHGQKSIMVRWHFDNCKLNNNE